MMIESGSQRRRALISISLAAHLKSAQISDAGEESLSASSRISLAMSDAIINTVNSPGQCRSRAVREVDALIQRAVPLACRQPMPISAAPAQQTHFSRWLGSHHRNPHSAAARGADYAYGTVAVSTLIISAV